MEQIFKHKRVAIDFDGTLVEDSKNIFEAFENNVILKAIEGAADTTTYLKEQGFEILIFTCRPDYHRKYMENILNTNDIVYDYILFYTKPRVDLYIDNKGFRFEDWSTTKDWIKEKLGSIGQEPQTMIEKKLRKQKAKFSDVSNMVNKVILDIGCGSGDVYNDLDTNNIIDGIEPDNDLIEIAKSRNIYRNVYNNINDINVEDYDYVTIFGVLEHIDDRKKFLYNFKDSKKIFITVPNANSFHKLLGLKMGLINDLTELTIQDHKIGHKIVFDKNSLEKEILSFCDEHNFRVSKFGSSSFKFTNNSEMKIFYERFDFISETAEEIGLCGYDNFYGAELFIEVEKVK
tara:strand:+ start:188 stop:1225 length:1038 start_codon:yes stop_codon:yes gene_type:complete